MIDLRRGNVITPRITLIHEKGTEVPFFISFFKLTLHIFDHAWGTDHVRGQAYTDYEWIEKIVKKPQ